MRWGRKRCGEELEGGGVERNEKNQVDEKKEAEKEKKIEGTEEE